MTAADLTGPDLAAAPDPWAMPAARILLPADAPRDEWLAARRQGIGGSDAPVLMGQHRHGSAYQVWLDKTGRADPDAAPSEQMIRGNWLEPHIADRFGAETGIELRTAGLAQSVDEPWLLVTVDRLLRDPEHGHGVLEIKSVGRYAEVRNEWREGVARDAYVQLQHQLAVTGLPFGYLAAYLIDTPPIYRGPFFRDEDLIARMSERFAGWWATHVLGDVPPPVNLDDLDTDEIRHRWPTLEAGKTVPAEHPAMTRALIAERRELSATEAGGRAAEKRRKEIDAALYAMVGDGSALVDESGAVLVTVRDQSGPPKVDPALAEDHPEIYARYITRTPSRRLTLPKES